MVPGSLPQTATWIRLLTSNQEHALAEIVRESSGAKLTRDAFVDRIFLVSEDIAGLERVNLTQDTMHRIWRCYVRS